MRKVFIDGGANLGQSAEAFCSGQSDAEEYEIFCFEPSQDEMNLLKPLRNKLAKLEEQVKEITLINKTIWIEDGEVTFYDKGTESNSIIFRDQFINNPNVKKITVESVNFSKWIQDNFTKDDHIILKLDIEGAEYEVFNQLCEDGIITWFDKIYAEIHGIKCGKTYKESIEMISEVNSYDKEIYIWNNLDKFGTKEWSDTKYDNELIQKEFILWYKRHISKAAERGFRIPYNIPLEALHILVEDIVKNECLSADFMITNSNSRFNLELNSEKPTMTISKY